MKKDANKIAEEIINDILKGYTRPFVIGSGNDQVQYQGDIFYDDIYRRAKAEAKRNTILLNNIYDLIISALKKSKFYIHS